MIYDFTFKFCGFRIILNFVWIYFARYLIIWWIIDEVMLSNDIVISTFLLLYNIQMQVFRWSDTIGKDHLQFLLWFLFMYIRLENLNLWWKKF